MNSRPPVGEDGYLFGLESVACPPVPTSPQWPASLAQYASAQRAAHRSPGTIRLHRHYLRGLQRLAPHPWTVTTHTLTDYLGQDGWAPETRKSARAAVRGFYRWGHGAGYVATDPAERLPAVTVPRALPRPTPEHLVEQIARRGGRVGFMARLAAYAGLRAAEIAGLHARCVLSDDTPGMVVLRILGKGGKVRLVPVVHRGLVQQLQEVQGYAFPGPHGHLSPGHVSRLLSEAMPPGWTAHTLRHRFATQVYDGTRDLLTLSELLGHARPETTQRYVRLSPDALRAAVAAAC